MHCTAIIALLCGAAFTLITAAAAASAPDSSRVFQQPELAISEAARKCVDEMSADELQEYLQFAIHSVEKQKALEKNLKKADIVVKNGSVSHVQLLDALPNKESARDSDIALKILKASVYAYNTKCASYGISGEECAAALKLKPLPKENVLAKQCEDLLRGSRAGHQPFRRLLQSHYQDGFYKMYVDNLPTPRSIARSAIPDRLISWFANDDESELFDHHRNLAFVQWAQFIEHDLSKPVVTSMCDGSAIECCKSDRHKLAPRHYHPACAPLLEREQSSADGSIYCVNYVRSALASKCAFGAAEQLNQATSGLDLSQLYGFTAEAEAMMRTFKSGQIKSSSRGPLNERLLPIFNKDASGLYCADGNSSCFIAGDSRVNNNPLAVSIYTLFMRNHNQIANHLRVKHASWSDEKLYQSAKLLNLEVYRRIVLDEWLPEVLGRDGIEELKRGAYKTATPDFEVSNEFAVAAIRFYFSMMPNELHDFSMSSDNNVRTNGDSSPEPEEIFRFNQENYRAHFQYTAKKLNDIFVSLLYQSAMKLDAAYVKNLLLNSAQMATSDHMDVLSFDIQRGRDHGLQPYVKYLKLCSNVDVRSWQDLNKFIRKPNLEKLRSVYKNFSDIDLIVGGISEDPLIGALVGPTFSCLIAEQFSKIHENLKSHTLKTSKKFPEMKEYKEFTAADLICLNSNLQNVPKSIFKVVSTNNPLVPCAERWQ